MGVVRRSGGVVRWIWAWISGEGAWLDGCEDKVSGKMKRCVEAFTHAGTCVETYRRSGEGVYRETQVHRYVCRDIVGLR